MDFKKFIYVIVLCFISFIPSLKAHRLIIPDGVYYYKPASTVYGVESIWSNPAGLARFNNSEFRLITDFTNNSSSNNYGLALNLNQLGLAWQRFHLNGEKLTDYSITSAFKLGSSLTGGSRYRVISGGDGYLDNLKQWDFGLSGKIGDMLRFGSLFSNLNHARVNDQKTETEMRYSLAIRPFDNLLTLSTDMFLSTGQRLRSADFIYQAEINPTAGLYISAFVTSSKDFQIGLRTNILNYIAGSQSNYNKSGRHQRTSLYLGSTNLRQPSLVKMSPRILNLKLSGVPAENPPRPIIGKKRRSYLNLLLDLKRASEDPSINKVMIYLNNFQCGFAQAQELIESISTLRKKGKLVYCHLSLAGNISYYIASACDKIFMPPVSQLNLVGLKAELSFYGKSLEKIGIKADVVRHGDYKSAPERLTRDHASDENKEQINRLLDVLYNQFIRAIAHGRNLSNDSLKSIVNNGPFTSLETIQAGLIDSLIYADELSDLLKQDNKYISLAKYHNDTLADESWKQIPYIGVIVASGEVSYSPNGLSIFSSQTDVTPTIMKTAFTQASHDNSIKAVLFRINSPGGDALAGDEIYHEADKFARKKKLYVSFGNVAASGGFYIAMAGEKIFVSPATITGSIGIFGGKVDLSALYEKLEIGKELYTRGKYAGMMSSIKPFTEDEREKYRDQMMAMYGRFVDLVADNRSLSKDSVEQLGQGKVWVGEEALKNKLVDSQGGFVEALDYVVNQNSFADYRIKLLPEKNPFIIWPGQSWYNSLVKIFMENKNPLDNLKLRNLTESDLLMMRLPYDIIIE